MPAQVRVNTLLNRMQPYPGFCYGSSRLKGDTLYVEVREHAGRPARCGCCQRPCPGYDRMEAREWLLPPAFSTTVKMVYQPRRVECPEHGVRVEHLPWSHGKSPLSLLMLSFLACWARRLPWQEVAEVFAVGWHQVYEAVAWAVHYGLAHRDLGQVRAIGVDEIHWGKGLRANNFLTVVYQIDAGARRLLAVQRGRSGRAFRRALRELGPSVCAGLRQVCSDMWKPYLQVIAAQLPQALHVLDRFHVCQHLNQAIDAVRRSETARLRDPHQARQLKGLRWTLLRRAKRVRGRARRKLVRLLASKLDTAQAWTFKESFQHFWSYRCPRHALRFLQAWCLLVRQTSLEPLHRVANLLESHQDLLRNWFIAKRQLSNAVAEGLNTKIRVVTRRAYGFRSYEVLQVALFHSLGRLPEPPHPHRFC